MSEAIRPFDKFSIASYDPPEYVRILGDAMREGLWPFKTDTSIYYQQRFDVDPCIELGFKLLPDLIIKLPVHIDLNYSLFDDAVALAQEAFEKIRYRPIVDREDHLILGEE